VRNWDHGFIKKWISPKGPKATLIWYQHRNPHPRHIVALSQEIDGQYGYQSGLIKSCWTLLPPQNLEHRWLTGVLTCVAVAEPTNYTKLSKKIIHRVDDLTNLSPYNPVVREITTDFKPTYISAKIVISSAVIITSYIKIRVTNTSEFKHSYYKISSNKSSGSI
jgi:hypothetical protein